MRGQFENVQAAGMSYLKPSYSSFINSAGETNVSHTVWGLKATSLVPMMNGPVYRVLVAHWGA